MTLRITVEHKAELSKSLKSEIYEWCLRVFPANPSIPEWAESEWLLIVWEDDVWVSVIELHRRTIKVSGESVLVGGIGGVMTLPDWRGQGYASAAMKQAVAFIGEEMAASFGLLICGPPLIPFYEALGWQVVDGPTSFEQTTGQQTFSDDILTMIYACSGKPWPGGAIDLCGMPW